MPRPVNSLNIHEKQSTKHSRFAREESLVLSVAQLRFAYFATIALVSTCISIASCTSRSTTPTASPVPKQQLEPLKEFKPVQESKPVLAKRSLEVGYVGSQACVACHESRVADFQKTGHFRTCRQALPEEMPVGFDAGRGNFTTKFPGLRFEMSRQGDEFLQTAIRTSLDREQRTTSRVDLILGAGTADDVYLNWRDDGVMNELPMAWIHNWKSWGTSHFNPYSAGDCSRPLTARCLECHNTWFDYQPGSINRYTPGDSILGVTCENCHGPGRDHVTYHQANPKIEKAQAIVHPGKLSRERQIEVCTQCHSNAIVHKGPAFSYRPGEPLDSYYHTIQPQFTEDDHVANQITYLRQSKCFQNSEMTCITCHDPHHARTRDSGEQSCRRCHEATDCRDHANLPEAVRDKCVQCHMPLYIKINVNFQTADDNFVPPIQRYQHRIAVYPEARKETLLEWYRAQSDRQSVEQASQLRHELIEFWREDARKCRDQHRLMGTIASLREAKRFDSESTELQKELQEAVAIATEHESLWIEAMNHVTHQRSAAAMDLFKRILVIKPDDANAHGRLGTLYAQSGNRELALEHLQLVSKYGPDIAYGEAMLGWLAFLDSRFSEAVEHYAQAEKVEPFDAKLNFQMGLALLRLEKLPEATERFRKAITIDPNRLDACRYLIECLKQQSKPDEAIAIAQQAVQVTAGKIPEVLITLADCYAEAGQYSEALATAERAEKAVSTATPPGLVDAIRKKQEEYRQRQKDQ